MKRLIITTTILYILLSSHLPPVLASGIKFQVNPGYDGYIVPGRWNPLWIKIDKPIESGRIEIVQDNFLKTKSSTIESYPLTGNHLECSVFVSGINSKYRIRLLSDGQLLAEQSLNLQSKVFPGHLILALGIPSSVQQTIEQILQPEEPMMVIPAEQNNFPVLGSNYDGVSGIVISDPASIFTPGQIQALRFWLIGGGKIIFVTQVQNLVSSWISELTGHSIDTYTDSTNSQKSFLKIPVGYGEITVIRGNITESIFSDHHHWIQLLALQSYLKSKRLTLSYGLPKPVPSAIQKLLVARKPASNSTINLSLFILIWTITGLIINRLSKKKRLKYILYYTLFATIIAFSLSNWVANSWQRGSKVDTRAIILPDSGGIMYDVLVQMHPLNYWKILSYQSAPWGVDLAFDKGDGFIRPKQNYSGWNHQYSSANVLVRSGNSTQLDLVGIIPSDSKLQTKLQNLIQTDSLADVDINLINQIVYWDGEQFWIRDKGSDNTIQWRVTPTVPEWLKHQKEWVSNLCQIPGSNWLICEFALPEFDFKIQTKTIPDMVIAIPVKKLETPRVSNQ